MSGFSSSREPNTRHLADLPSDHATVRPKPVISTTLLLPIPLYGHAILSIGAQWPPPGIFHPKRLVPSMRAQPPTSPGQSCAPVPFRTLPLQRTQGGFLTCAEETGRAASSAEDGSGSLVAEPCAVGDNLRVVHQIICSPSLPSAKSRNLLGFPIYNILRYEREGGMSSNQRLFLGV